MHGCFARVRVVDQSLYLAFAGTVVAYAFGQRYLFLGQLLAGCVELLTAFGQSLLFGGYVALHLFMIAFRRALFAGQAA